MDDDTEEIARVKRLEVAIVGGGLSGLAAAAALVGGPCRVELFEARRRLGGRAGSFLDPTTGQWTDLGQHVAMGCCTELLDLCRQTGLLDGFTRVERLHFITVDGRQHDFAPSRWLPAPLHLLAGLLGFSALPLAGRWRLARAVAKLRSAGDEGTIAAWLAAQGQQPPEIERFWKPLLISALGESLDRIAVPVARKVVVDGLLASRDAWQLLVPTRPLGELFDGRLGGWLAERGAAIHRSTPVRWVHGDGRRATAIEAGGRIQEFDAIILAVPWRQVGRLLAPPLKTTLPQLERLTELAAAPIASVHLRFDRPITDLPHAVLLDQAGQWLFNKGDAAYQIVVSAAHEWRGRTSELVAAVLTGLRKSFPAAAAAQMVFQRVVIEPEAVFSPLPGVDAARPGPETGVENLYLAGDYTATGWPATMESAVRSGRAAATLAALP